jgi:hypothetical protein
MAAALLALKRERNDDEKEKHSAGQQYRDQQRIFMPLYARALSPFMPRRHMLHGQSMLGG